MADKSAPRMMRIAEVMQQTGLSRSLLYRMIDAGDFPRPAKISEKLSAWPDNEVNAWIEARCAARG